MLRISISHLYAHGEYKWPQRLPARSRAPRRSMTGSAGSFRRSNGPAFADDIDAILELKRQRNAVVLAHNYQTPEIFHCVADIVGDSLLLAREATKVDADIIVLAGVHFMAETAKLLNPEKTVLIPDLAAGCSLAEFDYRSGCAADAPALSRRAGRRLRQYLDRGEGGIRHLLHLGQRARRRRVARRRARHHAARRISGAEHRHADQREDHRLEGPLRSARALHRFRRSAASRKSPRRHRSRASRVPARGRRGSGLLRIDRGDVGLRGEAAAAPRGAADGVLDERQRRGAASRCRVHPALQSLSAHEADHAEEHPPRAGDRPAPGRRSIPRSRVARGAAVERMLAI